MCTWLWCHEERLARQSRHGIGTKRAWAAFPACKSTVDYAAAQTDIHAA